MSSTVSSPRTNVLPTSAPTGESPRRRLRAVLALARFEAHELLLQIPVFVVLCAYVASTGWELWTGGGEDGAYPVLQDADRATQPVPLILGVAVLVCVNRAVLRSRRRGTDRHFDVLVMEPWRRTVAHLLSVVPFALATALVVAAQFAGAALRPGALGTGSFFELAVAPLAVLLFGVLGVLIARLIPSAFGAPLFVVGIYVAVAMLTSNPEDPHWLRWLAPVVDEGQSEPLPSDLLGRPAAWHALYLVGLIALVSCAAVLRGGRRTLPAALGLARAGRTPVTGPVEGPVEGRMRLVKAVALGAAVLTLAGAVGQSPGDSPALLAARKQASVAPEKDHTCVPHGRSTYCAFPEWTGRTEDWAAVVRRVQSLAGGAAGGTKLTVRQRIDARYGLSASSSLEPSGTHGQVTVGTLWGGNRVPEFSIGVASVLVAGDEEAAAAMCDGRVVTVMWLALATTSDPMASLRDVRIDDSVSGSAVVLAPTEPLAMTAAQTTVVRELLQRPRYGVTAKVKAHWTELTAPKTSTARAAELLDVPVPRGSEKEDKCEE
ncbi:ABC transporter permease [Streptomyces montanus]|uniref:ABC transporter permease n=1 Tax=Streptomyces montanus TaxID=2580423 RepID=A0A5R9FDE0_9ACTN|nr:ABC transporter permease [Streptomyces montanus]TLS39668.1 ABC transporter permease [Streptomyces montanus]